MALSIGFLKLTKYVYEHQPQMLEEMDRDELKVFLQEKADAAHKIYVETVENGKGYQLADELKHQALYEGLLFSPVSFVKSILNIKMGKDVTMAEAFPYYKKVKHLIDEYEPGDDFLGTNEEIELTEKIISFLS